MLENYEKLADIGKGKYSLELSAWQRESVRHFSLGLIFKSLRFCHNVGSFGRVSKIRRISDGRILVQKELDYGKMSEKEKQ